MNKDGKDISGCVLGQDNQCRNKNTIKVKVTRGRFSASACRCRIFSRHGGFGRVDGEPVAEVQLAGGNGVGEGHQVHLLGIQNHIF
jgi:hypothetical protein